MTDISTETVERLGVRLMQARDHAQKFIDHYFKNDAPRPQISIPASPKYDSDLIVHQAIKDAQETIPALAAERDALKAELHETRMQSIVDFGKLQEACEENTALKAEMERLRGVLEEAAEEMANGCDATAYRMIRAALQESTDD